MFVTSTVLETLRLYGSYASGSQVDAAVIHLQNHVRLTVVHRQTQQTFLQHLQHGLLQRTQAHEDVLLHS